MCVIILNSTGNGLKPALILICNHTLPSQVLSLLRNKDNITIKHNFFILYCLLWEQCIDEVYARQGKRQNSRPTECKNCPVRGPTRSPRLQTVSFQSYISHNFLGVCLSLFLPALSTSSYPLSRSLVIINQSITPLFSLHLLPNPLSYSMNRYGLGRSFPYYKSQYQMAHIGVIKK